MTTLIGSPGDDILTGTAEGDFLSGLEGNDTLYGLGGNDDLKGAAGNNLVYGGAGDDTLYGGFGYDSLIGGVGNDEIRLLNGDAFGGAGNDRISANSGFDSDVGTGLLAGGAGDDTLTGSDFASCNISGGNGNDRISHTLLTNSPLMTTDIRAGEGIDFIEVVVRTPDTETRINAGDGDDTILWQVAPHRSESYVRQQVTIEGGAGNDAVDIEIHGDYLPLSGTIDLGSGDDTFRSTGETNIDGHGLTIYAGDGSDSIDLDQFFHSATVSGGSGSDDINVHGYNIQIDAGNGVDTVFFRDGFVNGGRGDDYIVSYGGGTIYGGSGNEHIEVYGQNQFGQNQNTLVHGGIGDDFIFAYDSTADNNWLFGDSGNDLIEGGSGIDNLLGGQGADTLSGGEGQDLFTLNLATADSGVDSIQDFVSGSDLIRIAGSSLHEGTLGSGRFVNGNAALDASDRFVFDISSGMLYYDADGNGSQLQIDLAYFGGATNLTAADILVV